MNYGIFHIVEHNYDSFKEKLDGIDHIDNRPSTN